MCKRRPRRPRLFSIGLVAGIFLLWPACQKPTPPEAPTFAAVSDRDLDAVWDAALNVLRKHDFEPDRQDKALGVITTHPTTSMQWGEFWRQDVADPYSYLAASLHTIQRQVTVRFRRDAGWTVEVQVDVYRLSAPESQITTASSAIQAFSGVLPATDGTIFRGGTGREARTWVHLGRDDAMETRLLMRILASAGDMAPPMEEPPLDTAQG